MTAPPKNRWFRFGLRTMFVVLTVFAVWLGWNANIVRVRKEILGKLTSNGERHPWAFYTTLESLEVDPDYTFALAEFEYARVSSVRRLLGDESCLYIQFLSGIAPELIELTEHAFPEAELRAPIQYNVEENASRDALRKPVALRKENIGTLFKTGLLENSQP